MPTIKIREISNLVSGGVNGESNAVALPIIPISSSETKGGGSIYLGTIKQDDYPTGSIIHFKKDSTSAKTLLEEAFGEYATGSDDKCNQLKMAEELMSYTDIYTIIIWDDSDIFDYSKYKKLKDKSLYNFKFFTLGYFINGVSELSTTLDTQKLKGFTELCSTESDITSTSGRGDAIFLLDFKKDSKLDSVLSTQRTLVCNEIWSKYCAIFYPWVSVKVENSDVDQPASLAYLKSFYNSVDTNNYPDYFAISGYKRGTITGTPKVILGEIDMHNLQADEFYEKDSESSNPTCVINPTILCRDGNYRIWGNRTSYLDKGSSNSSNSRDCSTFLNVRHLLCDIKKQIYSASVNMSFEPKDDITWFNFKSLINPHLDKYVSNRGLEWYTWERLYIDDNGKQLPSGLIKARLAIKPIEAVESFDMTVYIQNDSSENL